MRKLILFIVCLLYFIPVCSQEVSEQQMIDSLLRKVAEAKDDTTKVKLYIQIQRNCDMGSPNIIKYGNIGLELSKKINWRKGISICYYQMGSYHVYQQREVALDYLRKAVEYAADEETKVRALGHVSQLYGLESNNALSLKYAKLGVDAAEKTQSNELKSDAYRNLGDVYRYGDDLKEAEEYYHKSLEYLEKDSLIDHSFSKAILYIYLSDSTKDPYSVLDYSMRVKNLYDSKKISDRRLHGIALYKIANAYMILVRDENLTKASGKSKNELLKKAETHINESFKIAKKEDDTYQIVNCSRIIHEIKALQGDYKSAYEYAIRHYAYSDSVFSQETKNELAAIESQKEIELRDQQIKTNELRLENENRKKWIYIGGLALLGIIAGLLLYQNRIRKKANEKLANANEMKARFFGILNHDLRGPVAGLISYLELKKAAPDIISAKDAADFEQKTIDTTQELLYNMESLLFWCKDQMQTFTPEYQPVPVSALFDDTKSFFSYESSVQLIFNPVDNITITTDENYVKTIMRNLTANAIKALEGKEGGKIEWNVIQKDNTIILSITDNGTGISPEKTEILQYGSNKASNIKDGLGLQIIHDLSTTIDCRIEVAASSSEGSAFYLIFK